MDDALEGGAKVLTGGKRAKMSGNEAEGNFYEPTILTGVKPDMKAHSHACSLYSIKHYCIFEIVNYGIEDDMKAHSCDSNLLTVDLTLNPCL